MITLKYGVFESDKVTTALMKLANHSRFTPKFALKVAKVVDEIKDHEQKVILEYAVLLKEHAQVDSQGNMLPKEGPDGKPMPNTFLPMDQAAWEKAKDEFSDKTFGLDVDPLPMKELEGVGLTPLELRLLEPLLIEMVLV